MKGNLNKHKCAIPLKLGITILATALALRVFIYRSTDFPPQTPLLPQHPTTKSKSAIEEPPPAPIIFTQSEIEPVFEPFDTSSSSSSIKNGSEKLLNVSDEAPHEEKCDLFTGEWIPNPAGPAYTNATCNLIESHQNCINNGRPDSGYLYWRWNPRNCGSLPLLDAEKFLEMMRNKNWSLIGDSISRNHVQSLICTLSQVEEAVLIYHDEDYRSKGWQFPSYNLTIYVLWSPFLTEATIFEDFNGVSTREIELHLDRLDEKWLKVYNNMDYMIFSTGKWFLKSAIYYENNTILGCHGCMGRNLTELTFDFAYRKALRTTLTFIATSGHKGLVFFRTSTPDHFEGGEWDNGGNCNRTVPFKEGEIQVKDLHTYLRRVELEEFETAAAIASQNGVRLKLLDFMQLSLLRPDGHPGPYREYHPFAKDKNARVITDCLHWCLPGPIDAWNDVIMQMVVNG